MALSPQKLRDNWNVEQKGAPLPPKSGSIPFLIFYEGGKGGCPAAGGKGERFCVPAVLSCDLRGWHLFSKRYIFIAKRHLAAFTKRVLTATMGPPAETGRCTKRKVWQTALLLRFSPATPGAIAADCAFITACFAWIEACVRAYW